eukprot:5710583-Prorocentrum_lima.AAC.1
MKGGSQNTRQQLCQCPGPQDKLEQPSTQDGFQDEVDYKMYNKPLNWGGSSTQFTVWQFVTFSNVRA